jgi:hypothetical protein
MFSVIERTFQRYRRHKEGGVKRESVRARARMSERECKSARGREQGGREVGRERGR